MAEWHQHFTPEFQFDAHNALSDVRVLSNLLRSSSLTGKQLLESSTTTASLIDHFHAQARSKVRFATFSPAIDTKALSKGVTSKAAESGLVFRHIMVCYQRESSDCVFSLLSNVSSGEVQVTKSQEVVDSLCDY